MKKLWKFLLVLIILAFAFAFPAIATAFGELLASIGLTGAPAAITSLLANAPWWLGAAVGVGLAYVIDPETTTEIITDVANAAGALGSAAASAAADVVGTFLSSPVGIGLLAFGAWFFFFRDDKEVRSPWALAGVGAGGGSEGKRQPSRGADASDAVYVAPSAESQAIEVSP